MSAVSFATGRFDGVRGKSTRLPEDSWYGSIFVLQSTKENYVGVFKLSTLKVSLNFVLPFPNVGELSTENGEAPHPGGGARECCPSP